MKKIIKLNFLHKLVLFCAALIMVRFAKTGHVSFLFLFWNLFLAWLPVFFIKLIKEKQSKLLRFCFLVAAILFLPNAPYILTDLFHLKKSLVAPLWFDLILILSFAILGMIYFFMALDLILKEIAQLFSFGKNTVIKLAIFLSTGYGIYLGRYLRFNSWDIISNPFGLAQGMFNSVFDACCYKETLSVTFTFTVFLYLIYETYRSFKEKQMTNSNELL